MVVDNLTHRTNYKHAIIFFWLARLYTYRSYVTRHNYLVACALGVLYSSCLLKIIKTTRYKQNQSIRYWYPRESVALDANAHIIHTGAITWTYDCVQISGLYISIVDMLLTAVWTGWIMVAGSTTCVFSDVNPNCALPAALKSFILQSSIVNKTLEREYVLLISLPITAISCLPIHSPMDSYIRVEDTRL